ncbi:hypothetical protein DFH06DRAFT_1368120 [Mycena polygramma]|nr:hypothetical protein DFH06DRAFT_1368120 [Mycena polygramma]
MKLTGMLFGRARTHLCLFDKAYIADLDDEITDYIYPEHPLYKASLQTAFTPGGAQKNEQFGRELPSIDVITDQSRCDSPFATRPHSPFFPYIRHPARKPKPMASSATQSPMDPTILSSTNCAPSHIEAEQISELIHQGDTAISQLDDDILRATGTLANLIQRRQARGQEVRSLRGLISPIRRFPPEILSEIFVLCLRNYPLTDSYTSVDPRQPPFLFGQICTSWRNISLTTPRLWNNIRISPTTPMRRGFLSLAGLFLERSRPISVRFAMAIMTGDNIGTPLTLLWSFSTRLESLRLDVPVQYLQPLVGMPDQMFPALRKLKIRITSGSGFVGTSAVFATAFSLQNLELMSPRSMPVLRLLSDFPWAQLTTFHLASPDSPFLTRSIVSECTALEVCSIEVLHRRTPPHPVIDLEGCIMPEMRTFTYKGAYDEEEEAADSAQFLKVFSFPNLRSLSLGMTPECGEVLLELHQRSGFGLENLTLGPINSNTEQIVDLLSKLPTLKKLELDYSDGAEDPLLSALTHSGLGSQIAILPQLESLVMRVSATTNGAVLISMVAGPRADRPSSFSACLALAGGCIATSAQYAAQFIGRATGAAGCHAGGGCFGLHYLLLSCYVDHNRGSVHSFYCLAEIASQAIVWLSSAGRTARAPVLAEIKGHPQVERASPAYISHNEYRAATHRTLASQSALLR